MLIICPCGKEFDGKRRTARFCSATCRVDAGRGKFREASELVEAAVPTKPGKKAPAIAELQKKIDSIKMRPKKNPSFRSFKPGPQPPPSDRFFEDEKISYDS